MITEVMKISEPPYTNRGVTRQKEDLTALIDWCQITVKGVDVFIIIEDILRIPLSFMELHGKEKGIAGHELRLLRIFMHKWMKVSISGWLSISYPMLFFMEEKVGL